MARVLVADDEEGIRSFVADCLEAVGHEVIAVGDGDAAWAEIARGERFDLLLTDLKMPGLDGLSLVRRALAAQPALPVVVLTAFGSVGAAVDAMKLGARDFVEKPLRDLATLRTLVATLATPREDAVSREELERTRGSDALWIDSDPAMQPLARAVDRVAPARASVLILGESGTGKSALARRIHDRSPYASGRFVVVNCAAIPEQLLESELFGHEKGAFTGAHTLHRGRIEQADGGTFFLDEIGDMDARLQSKLLRVIEERSFERVGGTRTITVSVRWIAATHRDLDREVAEGRFRRDLYHRLAVFPLRVPSLRERSGAVIPLALALLRELTPPSSAPLTLSAEAARAIESYAWPGNVRELRNALERGSILAERSVIDRWMLGLDAPLPKGDAAALAKDTTNLEALEVAAIRRALDDAQGNRKRAAEALGIGLRTLYEKLRRHGIA
jgi:two-component system, NtrC family, response regulator AtoC